MSRPEAELLGGIIEGLHWRDAAARVGLTEDHALSFLESVRRFASAVGSVSEFGAVELPDGGAGSGPPGSWFFVSESWNSP